MVQEIYRSTDASAPALTGQVGSLITVLDACLINGYGSKSAAGWSKVYSGTNKAAYQTGAGSLGFFFQVIDDGAVGGGALETRVASYETMSDVDTGTNRAPSAGSVFWRKSNTLDATARPWVIAADEATLWLWVKINGTNFITHHFGEFYSFQTGDAYKVAIAARQSSTSQLLSLDATPVAGPGLSIAGHTTYRPNGTTVSWGHMRLMGAASASGTNFPNQYDSLAYLGRQLVASDGMRGYLRGVYELLTSTDATDGDTFSGTGDFAGRTFQVIKGFNNLSRAYAIETSSWDTST